MSRWLRRVLADSSGAQKEEDGMNFGSFRQEDANTFFCANFFRSEEKGSSERNPGKIGAGRIMISCGPDRNDADHFAAYLIFQRDGLGAQRKTLPLLGFATIADAIAAAKIKAQEWIKNGECDESYGGKKYFAY